jgi:hypothetical protein
MLFGGVFLNAQIAAEPGEENLYDNLLLKVAVFGPSDDIFIWWGHAALIVEDTVLGHSRMYDWGIYNYPSDSFMKDFAFNTVRYRCGVSNAQLHIVDYIGEDRDIVFYLLDIEESRKKEILDYAENNILPENCWYIYHLFYDNCSTRIRDLIDMGTGDQLKKYSENTRGRFTYREHMRRFTWYNPFYDWFLGFLLGRDVDKNITAWQEMYLPIEIGRIIEDFSYIDDSGDERRLVSNVEIVNRTKSRMAVLDAPRSQVPRCLAAGLTIAALLALNLFIRRKHPLAGRRLWGISHTLLGFFFGSAGTILFMASRIEERDIARHNINFLFINPLLLAAIPLGICVALNKKINFRKYSVDCEQCLWIIWLYAFISALIAGFLGFIPALYQQNLPTVALVLPVTLALILPGLSCLKIHKNRHFFIM